MALALLELTETAAGEVLEQLVVTTESAAAGRNRALGDALNRVRVYAQLASELPGVPRSVRVQLDRAAWASVFQMAQRRRAQRALSAPYMALWRHGQLQELHSHSLAESLDVWHRLAAAGDDSVLIELSEPGTTDAVEHHLARFYSHLSATLVASFRPQEVATSASNVAAARPDTHSPVPQLLHEAAAQRQALAAQWLSAAQVSARLGSQAANGSHRASQLRRDGQLLGVYISHPSPSYRYPTWQFRADGQPIAHLTEILRVLRDFGPFEREPDGLRRTTGWGEVEWFLAPHALLDGATPADMLATDPGRVLQAARTEFEDEA
ncbi:hypothetical protein [Stenotrophomonas maltophilia]|uniref:hypothetical protein n=1 Tax=Stenotrophomonas maltophilia TaxID=40324 RepID=UPI001EF84A3D|nr:hypothetical protein [Stenotrophomonas maltophilia]